MTEEVQLPQRGPRGVRDVCAEQLIRAYAEDLKANNKVCATSGIYKRTLRLWR